MTSNIVTGTPVFRCNATLGNENMNPVPDNIKPILTDMRNELRELNKKVDDQAKSIANLTQNLAQNNYLMKQMMDKVSKKAKFPINDVELRHEIEIDISRNKEIYVNILKNIIQPIGINQGMKKILTDEVIIQINYDGLQNKLAFKQFECLNNALFDAVRTDGYTKDDFVQDIKKAFKKEAGSLKRKHEAATT